MLGCRSAVVGRAIQRSGCVAVTSHGGAENTVKVEIRDDAVKLNHSGSKRSAQTVNVYPSTTAMRRAVVKDVEQRGNIITRGDYAVVRGRALGG